MSLENEADIDRLAKLCRIKCTEEEKANFETSITKVLGYMELIREVDTGDIEPCTHVLETVVNVMGNDEPQEGMSRDDFLKNAPEQVGGMIKVPAVIQFEE